MASQPEDPTLEGEVAEGLRLLHELDQCSQRDDADRLLDITSQINDLVIDEDKYALREKLIEKDFIQTFTKAVKTQWPSQRLIETDDTELFETMTGIYVWFCQEITKYSLSNRTKFADESCEVIVAALALPEQQAGPSESAWGEMFMYISPKVLSNSIDQASCQLDPGRLDYLNDKIDQSRIGRGAYTRLDFFMDLLFAPMSLILDVGQFPGFLANGDFQLIIILYASHLLKGLAAGFLNSDVSMWAVRPECLKKCIGDSEKAGKGLWVTHNFLTLGYSGLVMQLCNACHYRQKSDSLVRMKIFDSMTSSISFIIAGLTIMNDHYTGWQRVIKWASLLYSFYSISSSSLKASKGALYDYRHYFKHSTHKSNTTRKFIRSGVGTKVLLAFHMSEVLGIFVLLLAENCIPFTLVWLLGIKMALLIAFMFWYSEGQDENGVGHERWKMSLFASVYMWSNPLLGPDDFMIAHNLAVVYLRPMPWIAAWILMLFRLDRFRSLALTQDGELVKLVYVVFGVLGTVMYAMTAFFFYKIGLWEHGEKDEGEKDEGVTGGFNIELRDTQVSAAMIDV